MRRVGLASSSVEFTREYRGVSEERTCRDFEATSDTRIDKILQQDVNSSGRDMASSKYKHEPMESSVQRIC
jgi:hypothetical protein